MSFVSCVKTLIWTAALSAVVYAALDPELRAYAPYAAGAILFVPFARLLLRRRRLGRATFEELDAMSGAAFEDYVAERVRAAGWSPSAIFRSGDFGADLVAERDGVRVAVQAKRRAKSVGNRAVQEALAGADYHGCDAALVVTQSRFTEAARRQAERARLPVRLVARGDLTALPRRLDELAREAREARAEAS